MNSGHSTIKVDVIPNEKNGTVSVLIDERVGYEFRNYNSFINSLGEWVKFVIIHENAQNVDLEESTEE